MAIVTTAAVVLRTYRYSETSKIVRLATREIGVQSAIAKGALRPKSRFGAALEFLSEGEAQLYVRDTRDLQTLAAFDVVALRQELAAGVARFHGGAALAEVMLHAAPPAPLPAAYDTLLRGLDLLVETPSDAVDAAGARAVWLLVAALGFAPALESCVRDGGALGSGPVAFSPSEGGVLCPRCAGAAEASRLKAVDYQALVTLNDERAELPALDGPHAAAHRRLAARFVRHHVGESMPALDAWERQPWTPPLRAPAAS